MVQSAPSGDSSGSPKWSLVAHSLIYALGVAFLVRVASWFGLLEDVSGVAMWALIPFIGISTWHQMRGGLCLRCMAEVPDDAPVRAERHRVLLRMAHFNSVWAIIAVTVAFLVLGRVVLAPLLDDDDSTLFLAPADMWIFALIYGQWLHHRLRPWCPYCRDWGDDGDPEPSPDPTTSGTRTAY